MWLFTSVGFYSVVQREGEGDLTVRAHDRDDLELLRESYLPSLGPIREQSQSDYPYLAAVRRGAFAEAVARLVRDIDYPCFRDHVAEVQGEARAAIYAAARSRVLSLK